MSHRHETLYRLPGWGTSLIVAILACLGAPLVAVPRIDHEAETTYRQLTWEDFRGPVQHGQQQAWLVSTIRLGSSEIDFEDSDAGLLARLRYPAAYAVVNKLESGVVPGARDEQTLRHEQTHFDITEIHARRLALELPDIFVVRPDGNRQLLMRDLDQAVGEAYQRTMQSLDAMQSAYDGETRHGLRRHEQRQWERSVAELLDGLEPYPLR